MYSVNDLAYAFGKPCVTGQLKQLPEDFRVDEIAGFEPEGQGEHVYLTIEKKGLTTNAVASQLKKFCALQQRDIGYAGMKDKQAITTQQFSVNLAGKAEPDWSGIESDQLKIIKVSRHKRKLKRGVLKGNRFEIGIRELAGDIDELHARLNRIKLHGVPNYFGAQRFGINGSNIDQASKLFNHELAKVRRDERSILLSAARSMLFNAVLDARVKQDNWYQLLPGEVINLDGTQRHFAEQIDETLLQRAAAMDVHPTGPLYGLPSRALVPSQQAGELENGVLEDFAFWKNGLQAFKLEQARRPLRVAVRNLEWQIQQQDLTIKFALTAGAYATVVLREFLADG